MAAGLDGMECYYPKFTQEQTALAEQLSDEFGILRSGGSDFHGQNKPDIQLGIGRGNLRVSCNLLEQLRKNFVEITPSV